ncbi:MAG: type IX secretion system membrane protein PorP/SprF [Bacteroidales bacterium]|nr:type IX secretion system membrane protein PorP/SprF [Bacteroidales bacterium]
MGSAVVYNVKPHFYATAGYKFRLQNPSFELSPSVFITSETTASRFKANAIVTYNKKLWGGVTLSLPEFNFMGGVALSNDINLGISYGFSASKLGMRGNYLEILINYSFEVVKDKTPQKYKSIRYL